MSTFLYFAYGSNMLSERLKARCPSATVIGNVTAIGYRVEFWKSSKDKSGKATLVKGNDTDAVNGVLFEIDTSEIKYLDRAEGAGVTYKNPGYDRIVSFKLVNLQSDEITATTYIAKDAKINRDLLPFDWYVALVKAGAERNGTACQLDTRDLKVDMESSRETRDAALIALSEAKQLARMKLDHYKTHNNKHLNWLP